MIRDTIIHTQSIIEITWMHALWVFKVLKEIKIVGIQNRMIRLIFFCIAFFAEDGSYNMYDRCNNKCVLFLKGIEKEIKLAKSNIK